MGNIQKRSRQEPIYNNVYVDPRDTKPTGRKRLDLMRQTSRNLEQLLQNEENESNSGLIQENTIHIQNIHQNRRPFKDCTVSWKLAMELFPSVVRTSILIILMQFIIVALSSSLLLIYKWPGDAGTGTEFRDCSRDSDGLAWVNINDCKTIRFGMSLKSEDEAFTYEEAVQECQGRGAELWEVRNAEEWHAVMASAAANPEKNIGFWLNARPMEACPMGKAAYCRKDEAALGRGLRVRWSKSGKNGTYSRLVGGPDVDCIYAEASEGEKANAAADDGGVWRKVDCHSGYLAACVKRGCRPPPSF